MKELLRTKTGRRIRCYWWRDEPEECTGDGWASYREYFLDADGYVPYCYQHSNQWWLDERAKLIERGRKAGMIK